MSKWFLGAWGYPTIAGTYSSNKLVDGVASVTKIEYVSNFPSKVFLKITWDGKTSQDVLTAEVSPPDVDGKKFIKRWKPVSIPGTGLTFGFETINGEPVSRHRRLLYPVVVTLACSETERHMELDGLFSSCHGVPPFLT